MRLCEEFHGFRLIVIKPNPTPRREGEKRKLEMVFSRLFVNRLSDTIKIFDERCRTCCALIAFVFNQHSAILNTYKEKGEKVWIKKKLKFIMDKLKLMHRFKKI